MALELLCDDVSPNVGKQFKQECIPVGCVYHPLQWPSQGEEGVSALGGSAQGWVSARGCLPRWGGVCLGDRMTDRCKNITLPQLCCGR